MSAGLPEAKNKNGDSFGTAQVELNSLRWLDNDDTGNINIHELIDGAKCFSKT